MSIGCVSRGINRSIFTTGAGNSRCIAISRLNLVSCSKFGSSPFNKPLGGSETSIVHMARALVTCGHIVTAYVNCPNPGVYDGVFYRHYHDFFEDYLTMAWEAVISFRSFDWFSAFQSKFNYQIRRGGRVPTLPPGVGEPGP